MPKVRAPRNRTIALSDCERNRYRRRLITLTDSARLDTILDRTIHQDFMEAFPYLPVGFVDLLFVDPPYNLSKQFGSRQFKSRSIDDYFDWFDGLMTAATPMLTPTASIYVCSDWRSSPAVYESLSCRFQVRNRITWEREKGRGAKANWKNSSEDIWFATVGDAYTFNVDAVKVKRQVLAPYTQNGAPKDWDESRNGKFRLTHPSNLWTDLTVPFWSMPENTDHPTQKPEKLLAKVILASSNPGDVVFDPCLGSGTTSVAAKKLGRRYVGVEREWEYCCLAEKRLELANVNLNIQGYADGVFWERNTLNKIKTTSL